MDMLRWIRPVLIGSQGWGRHSATVEKSTPAS